MGRKSQASEEVMCVPIEVQPFEGRDGVMVEVHPYLVCLISESPPQRCRQRCCRWGAAVSASLTWFLLFLLSLLVLGGGGGALWPHNPELRVAHMKLEGVHVQMKRSNSSSILPKIFLDISLKLTLRVHNDNFFGVRYRSIRAAISYDGDEIGHVNATGGTIPARRTGYVDANLEIIGFDISNHIFSLVSDLAKKELPLSTTAHFDGEVKVLLLNLPLETNVSCDLVVNPEDQSIKSKGCELEE